MQFLVRTFDKGAVDWPSQAAALKEEARRVLDLCEEGVIRNIWFSERRDAVLVLEEGSLERAVEAVDGLPLVRAGLLQYEITSLLPYTGFERLADGTSERDRAER